MIQRQHLPGITSALVAISVLFAILSASGIRYQFYLWELYFDGKIIFLAGVIFLAWKKQWIVDLTELTSLFRFQWKSNAVIFFIPVLLYIIPIAAGLIFNSVTINKLDNSSTLILATLFDIPAIFTFSATSVLVEEIVFRGLILGSLRKQVTVTKAIVLTNGLWMVFCLSEIIGIDDVSFLKAGMGILFFFSLGVLCSFLTLKNGSIWQGYSIRVGIISLTPIILTSFLAESDSFFTTGSVFFAAEGIIVSALFLMLVWLGYRRLSNSQKTTEK